MLSTHQNFGYGTNSTTLSEVDEDICTLQSERFDSLDRRFKQDRNSSDGNSHIENGGSWTVSPVQPKGGTSRSSSLLSRGSRHRRHPVESLAHRRGPQVRPEEARRWIGADHGNGYVRVYNADGQTKSHLVACRVDTPAHKICSQLGIPLRSLHVQYCGDRTYRLDFDARPLELQNDFLFRIGIVDIRRQQKLGTSWELGYLLKFYSGPPYQDSTYGRRSLASCLEVKKSRMFGIWKRRLCILAGTRLLIHKGTTATSAPTVLYLAKGDVTTEKSRDREYCAKVTSHLQSGKSFYLSMNHQVEFERWHTQLKHATTKQPRTADLSHCNLEVLPGPFFSHIDLDTLNVRHNSLRSRPANGGEALHSYGWIDDFVKFNFLAKLDISDNSLGEFPITLCQLVNLVELNLSSNKIAEIPPEISLLQRLEVLNLHNNHLSQLPDDALDQLPNLRLLPLSFNHFCTVPWSAVSQSSSSENLYLAGNQLYSLEENLLVRLRGTKCIDLRLNKLSLTPQETAQFDILISLTHLDLRDNAITHLDLRPVRNLAYLNCERNDVVKLQLNGSNIKIVKAAKNRLCNLLIEPKPDYLEDIDLSHNAFTELPQFLASCFLMKKLTADHNYISVLPEGIFSDPGMRLRILKVSHNCISRFPMDIFHVPLEELYMHNNQISDIPEFFLMEANRLKLLNLSKNHLTRLPNLQHVELHRMQELYLSFNGLTEDCLRSILAYSRLRVLHVAYNQIADLCGKHIEKFEMLRELNISGNQLESLPKELLQMKNLVMLRAHCNQLISIPDFGVQGSLKVLDLGSNSLMASSFKGLMDSQLTLLDVSGNTKLNVSMKDFDEMKTKRRVALVDMTGENRDLSGSVPRHLDRPNLPLPFMIGLTETAGNRNRLCVSVVKKLNFPTPGSAVLGMFDGGLNNLVPRMLQKVLHETLISELRKGASEEEALKYTMLGMHKRLGPVGQRLGASGAIVYLRCTGPLSMDTTQWTLHVANVGDVLAVLCGKGRVQRLTRSFRASVNAEERDRICMDDGFISDDDMVNGTVRCTRQLGCGYLFPHLLPDPHVSRVPLTLEEDCLILGCKGLWDHVTPEEAAAEVAKERHPVAAAKRLLDLAQAYGSSENLSLLVMKFDSSGEFGPAPGGNYIDVGRQDREILISEDEDEDPYACLVGQSQEEVTSVQSQSVASATSQESLVQQPIMIDKVFTGEAKRLSRHTGSSGDPYGGQHRYKKRHEMANELDRQMRDRLTDEVKEKELITDLDSIDSRDTQSVDSRVNDNWSFATAVPASSKSIPQFRGKSVLKSFPQDGGGGTITSRSTNSAHLTSDSDEDDYISSSMFGFRADRLGDAAAEPQTDSDSDVDLKNNYTYEYVRSEPDGPRPLPALPSSFELLRSGPGPGQEDVTLKDDYIYATIDKTRKAQNRQRESMLDGDDISSKERPRHMANAADTAEPITYL